MTAKEQIIKEVYENPVSGYGSIKDSFQQAIKKDASITYDDVNKYLNKLQHRQTQFTYKKFNSFISKHPLYDFEIDLIDLTDEATTHRGIRYGLTAIDTFTKIAHVVPIKTKTPTDVVKAMEDVIKTMGVPTQIMTDGEGAFNSSEYMIFKNEHRIKHQITVSSAHMIERFNRTFKEQLQTRLDAMNLSRDKWLGQIKFIVDKYNNSNHRTIGMTPNQAKIPANELLVKFNINEHSRMDRKYPELLVGSNVRALLRKDTKTKGYFPKWSIDVYNVLFIKDGDYIINDTKRKVYMRHELLKV